jgi:hypothetical protein
MFLGADSNFRGGGCIESRLVCEAGDAVYDFVRYGTRRRRLTLLLPVSELLDALGLEVNAGCFCCYAGPETGRSNF